MDKQRKTLLCMYVDDFCGIKKESFNFFMERRYMIKRGKISRKSDEELKGLPTHFWGDNVSAVTLLIGENGAGKTTLMRLLIKWLCQLSAGHIPQEKGALVINIDDEDRLIAFDDGKPWTIEINKNEKTVSIEDIDEIKKMLSDIRLIYYTDTMTDLELRDTLEADELDFLIDDSLFARLSNLSKGKFTVGNIYNCIKSEDFKRQMRLFLYSRDKENPGKMKLFLHDEENLDSTPEFLIRYMKFKSTKVGDEKGFKKVLNGNGSLIGEAIDFWNKVFADNINNNLPDIARALLWGVFSGTITSLLQWERTLSNLKESIVNEQIRSSLRAFIKTNYNDWNIVFKRFFTNMFSDCKRAFDDVHRYEEFCIVWDKQILHNINSFLDALENIETRELLKKWMSSEDTQNTWKFNLDYFNEKTEKENSILVQDWEYLWEHYLAVAHLMPECRFDWLYPSSGEANKANLYCTMQVDSIGDCNNMWFLLDEPDNTFHPDWKRRTIQDFLDICSIYDINFQMLISTHSPIMLSDVPKQAAILLKTAEKKEYGDTIKIKQQSLPKSSPFGQQIYTLFNDAFFMKQGITGSFADMKIRDVYNNLDRIEAQFSEREKNWEEKKSNEFDYDLKICETIIRLVEEPLLHGYLSQSYKLCSRRIKELR